MTVAMLAVVSVALLALPGVARPLGRRLAPSEWSRVVGVALASGFVGLEISLVLAATPTVLHAIGVPALASACQRTLALLTPANSVAGWFAAAAALAIATVSLLTLARARRVARTARAELCVGRHERRDGYEIVVMPSPRVLAFGVPGRPGQVVLTEGLARSLSPGELDVVINHEIAHLECGHHRQLRLAAVLDATLGWLPFVRLSTHALRSALERWADEDAAATTPAARAYMRAALLKAVDALERAVALPQLFSRSTVAERVAALEHALQPPWLLARVLVHPLVAALSVAGLVSTGVWLRQLRAVLAIAGVCPM